MKYRGFCTPFSPLTKTVQIVAGETTRYRSNSSLGLDGLSNGEEERYDFRSIQRTFSMCRRKVGTYLLLLGWTCSMQLPYRSSSIPPWWFSMEFNSLWPISYLGWPQYLFGTPWTSRIFLLSPRTHTCLDSVSCYKTKGCRRSLWGHLSGRPPICFSPVCCPRRLAHSSQSDVWTSCSSALDTWRPHSWVQMASFCSWRDPS